MDVLNYIIYFIYFTITKQARISQKSCPILNESIVPGLKYTKIKSHIFSVQKNFQKLFPLSYYYQYFEYYKNFVFKSINNNRRCYPKQGCNFDEMIL